MGRLTDWWKKRAGASRRPVAPPPPPGARFNQIGTSYRAAASSTATTWSAPNPYAGFDPRAPQATRFDPASTETPPWGTPSGRPKTPRGRGGGSAGPPTTASAPPGPPLPTGARPGAPGLARRKTKLPGVLGFAVAALVVIAGALSSALGGSGDGDGDLGDAPELDEAWTVSSYDHSDYGTYDSADGTLPGSTLTTSHGLVVMIEPSTVDASLLSLDPGSGSVQWSAPMPEARCTAPDPDTLLCLTRGAGSTFDLVTLDVATGEPVGDPVPTEISHVPVVLLPVGADSLVALSVGKELTAIDRQGATLWEETLDAPDLDTSYVQADVAHYESSLILSFGWLAGTVLVTPEGSTSYACDSVAATPEAWMCRGEDEAIGFAPDGTELWRAGWQDYYLIDRYQHIAPVMLVDNWDGTVSSVDPLTGAHGPAVAMDEESSYNFLGDPEHPFVLADSSVSLLSPDLTRVVWTAPVVDGYLNIAGGGVVGDTLVIDGEHSWGLDLADGARRWERDFLTTDTRIIDDALYGLGTNELIRYDLP